MKGNKCLYINVFLFKQNFKCFCHIKKIVMYLWINTNDFKLKK